MCSNGAADSFSDIEHSMMRRALALAAAAADAGEVPVGAVIWANDGKIVGEGRNETLAANDIGAHAEMFALRRANAALGNYRLPGLHIAVSLEPCPMCAGAIFQARLATLIFAAADTKTGACGGVVDLSANTRLNHQTTVRGGLFADTAAALLKDFFRCRR